MFRFKKILATVIIASLFSIVTGVTFNWVKTISVPQPKHRVAQAFEESSSSAKIASPSTAIASPKPATPSAQIPESYGAAIHVPILTYHYIGLNPNPKDTARDALSVAPDKFDAQLGVLQQHGYTPISFDNMYAALKGGSLPSKPIILTFDDGYIDFYTTAFPILKKYNFHATSFIPTGLMSQGYYMSWAQIREIDSSGLVSFLAHSVNHPNLTSLNHDQLVYQLAESKKILKEQLGKPVNFMAYPYGASNSSIWEETKKQGYLGSVGTYYGTTESDGNLFDMPRIKISGAWSTEDFDKRFP